MKHRITEFVGRNSGAWLALVSLCFCVSSAFAAKPEWPQRYNAGVTAYRSNDFTSAATAFEEATASPDRELRERSLYNLGNTYYRIGQAMETQGTEQAIPVFKKSLKGYEDTLAFNPKDADAQFNRDLVKKKIEELQKKQEQQQQDQQKQDQQKKDDKKQEQQQNQQDQKKDDQKQDQQRDQQQKDQQSQQQQDKDKQQQQDQQKNGQEKEKQQEKEQQAQQQAGQTNSLQKVQAQAILDNLREDERNWNFFPEVQMKDLKDKGGPVKDW